MWIRAHHPLGMGHPNPTTNKKGNLVSYPTGIIISYTRAIYQDTVFNNIILLHIYIVHLLCYSQISLFRWQDLNSFKLSPCIIKTVYRGRAELLKHYNMCSSFKHYLFIYRRTLGTEENVVF